MKPLTFAPYLPNFAIFPSLIPYLSSLFVSHRFSRMDMRDQVTGCDKYEDTYQ